jgi:hypothetical protein
MAIGNANFKNLVDAITPFVSIGVGSAICKVCMAKKIDPEKIETKDIPMLKKELIEHYRKFWQNQLANIEQALTKV